MRKAIFVFLCLPLFLGAAPREEIVALLQKWPQDFNAKKKEAVCALFATDLVASYPNTPDRNYQEMCQTLSAAIDNPDLDFSYEAPEIEQILVADTLAAVRLIWTLKIVDRQDQTCTTVREKGLDIFRREKGGNWKIAISYAYPEEGEAP